MDAYMILIIASETSESGDTSEHLVTIDERVYDRRSVYISFEHIRAIDTFSNQVGLTHTGSIIALPSSRLFSIRKNVSHVRDDGTRSFYAPYSFNFADLQQ